MYFFYSSLDQMISVPWHDSITTMSLYLWYLLYAEKRAFFCVKKIIIIWITANNESQWNRIYLGDGGTKTNNLKWMTWSDNW